MIYVNDSSEAIEPYCINSELTLKGQLLQLTFFINLPLYYTKFFLYICHKIVNTDMVKMPVYM